MLTLDHDPTTPETTRPTTPAAPSGTPRSSTPRAGRAPARVHVVDDDPGVLESLAMLLQANHMEAAAFDSAEAFLEGADPAEVACLVLDLRMPGLGGEALIERLVERRSLPPTIVVTAHGDVPAAVRAMRLGVLDFLQKPYETRQLLDRIESALAVADRTHSIRAKQAALDERLGRLTRRETDVLRGVVRGLTSRRIAAELGLKPKSVEIYRGHVLTKMEAESSVDLVRRIVSLRPELAAADVPTPPGPRDDGP